MSTNRFLLTGLAVAALAAGCSKNSTSQGPALPPSDAPATAAATPEGNREGNGGDYARSTFIRMGKAVMKFLESDARGQLVVQKHNLSLDTLRATLSIDRIAVRDAILVDNGGSDVDALGDKVLGITLSKQVWMDHFERERDVYYLVFHDMLRSAGVNDDDYVISDALRPFPEQAKIETRISPLGPLHEGDSLAGALNLRNASINGSGCPHFKGTFLDFDVQNNVLELTPLNYFVATEGLSDVGLARATCNFAIPFDAGVNRRLVVTQIDIVSSVMLMPGTSYSVSSEAFVVGSKGKAQDRTIGKPYGSQTLAGGSLMRVTDEMRTPCGRAHLWRLNTSARLQGLMPLHQSAARVLKIKVYFRAESCLREDYHHVPLPPGPLWE